MKKLFLIVSLLILASMILPACAPQVQEKVVEKIVSSQKVGESAGILGDSQK